MSVKAPEEAPSAPNTLRWIFSAILCLCTLVALWATGARVKAAKLAARGKTPGERIVDSAGELRASSRLLRRGVPTPVEHFTLTFDGRLTVADASGRPCVEFTDLAAGQVRRWQELQVTILEAEPESLRIETEQRPGSPCFGPGEYRALRQGLRIEFPGVRAVTIAAYDPAKPSMLLKFEAGPEAIEQPLAAGAALQLLGIGARLEQDRLTVTVSASQKR